jgi:hypothetical protein
LGGWTKNSPHSTVVVVAGLALVSRLAVVEDLTVAAVVVGGCVTKDISTTVLAVVTVKGVDEDCTPSTVFGAVGFAPLPHARAARPSSALRPIASPGHPPPLRAG